MSQSRRDSALESITNIAVGFGIALATQVWVTYKYQQSLSFWQNIQITLIFTVVSFVRSYLLRRLFNRWHFFGRGQSGVIRTDV